jgi:hypothetical protein
VEFYRFFWGALAWIAAVAWFPFNVPLLALAYKIQNGPRPLSIDRDELWYRAFIAGLLLFLTTAGFILLDYFLADWSDMPPGPVHLVIFMGYVPAATWVLFFCFGYSDFLDGLGVFTIFFGLTIAVLLVLNAIFGLWSFFLNFAYSWLRNPA